MMMKMLIVVKKIISVIALIMIVMMIVQIIKITNKESHVIENGRNVIKISSDNLGICFHIFL